MFAKSIVIEMSFEEVQLPRGILAAPKRQKPPPCNPGEVHWWELDGRNRGLCRRCGQRHDFSPVRADFGRAYENKADELEVAS